MKLAEKLLYKPLAEKFRRKICLLSDIEQLLREKKPFILH